MVCTLCMQLVTLTHVESTIYCLAPAHNVHRQKHAAYVAIPTYHNLRSTGAVTHVPE